MKTIELKIPQIRKSSKLFNMYFENMTYAVLDIETTGLMPFRDSIILSGLVVVSTSDIISYQFFAESPSDEAEIISRTSNILNAVDFVVTYNGRFFDVPFIKKRASRINIPIPEIFNLDLYTIMKHYSALPELLESMSQKSLEKYMGILSSRSDNISGYESVQAYDQYLQKPSKRLEDMILLHNYDDIMQLYRLLDLLPQSNLHKALFKSGFPVSPNTLIRNIKYSKLQLTITGNAPNLCEYMSFPAFDSPYTLRQNSDNSSFEIVIDCEKEGDVIFFDAKSMLGTNIESISKYPAVSDGYLIVKDSVVINHMELNLFAKKVTPMILHFNI